MNYPSLSKGLVSEIASHGIDIDYVTALIERAFVEDLGEGDKTSTAAIDAQQQSTASLRARKAGVVAGVCLAAATFELAGVSKYQRLLKSGDRVEPGQEILTVVGATRSILLAERVALNLISHLSGVATLTRAWVDAVAGTGTIIRDTRKTTPGLRKLEKYAVRCGGGQNHRMSLSDAALVKDNHIAAAGGVAEAFRAVREHEPDIAVEIEVDTLDQLREALAAGADLVLLDNMAPDVLREAVAISREHSSRTGRKVILEASGGLTLSNAGAVGATGVDYISVGGLTHSSPILDIGLDYVRTL